VIVLAVTGGLLVPWMVRYAVVTGTPALYNESPFSNLVLMGTWFRVFDERTFSELQQIETAPGSREQAIAQAATVGPRPELSQRYMEQARGPYERPLGETLDLALGNIRLNLRQYLVNHLLLAPVLIWAGHTPMRQADAPNLPSSARYAIWGAELILLLLAFWQCIGVLRDPADASPARGAQPAAAAQAGPRTMLGHRMAAPALALSFLAVFVFLTAVHVVIAVDERFTTPALPLVGILAGARLAQLVAARQQLAVRFAA
jgi:hypothetical protein